MWTGKSASKGFESVLRKRRDLATVKLQESRDLDGSGLEVQSGNHGLLSKHKVEVGS